MNRTSKFMPNGRLIAVLWLLVLFSALLVAYIGHLCREQYAQLSALQREADQLQEVYGKYLLEQSAWGGLQRVEQLASQKLSMHSPAIHETVVVKDW